MARDRACLFGSLFPISETTGTDSLCERVSSGSYQPLARPLPLLSSPQPCSGQPSLPQRLPSLTASVLRGCGWGAHPVSAGGSSFTH